MTVQHRHKQIDHNQISTDYTYKTISPNQVVGKKGRTFGRVIPVFKINVILLKLDIQFKNKKCQAFQLLLQAYFSPFLQ